MSVAASVGAAAEAAPMAARNVRRETAPCLREEISFLIVRLRSVSSVPSVVSAWVRDQ